MIEASYAWGLGLTRLREGYSKIGDMTVILFIFSVRRLRVLDNAFRENKSTSNWIGQTGSRNPTTKCCIKEVDNRQIHSGTNLGWVIKKYSICDATVHPLLVKIWYYYELSFLINWKRERLTTKSHFLHLHRILTWIMNQ